MSDPTPPEYSRPGVYYFLVADRVLCADAAQVFLHLSDHLDSLTAILPDVVNGLPITATGRESWQRLVGLARTALGLSTLAHDGSGASDAEAIAALLGYLQFAGVIPPNADPDPDADTEQATEPEPPEPTPFPAYTSRPAPGIN